MAGEKCLIWSDALIESIAYENRHEAIEALAKSFAEHPMMPVDPTGKKARRMMRTLIEAFGSAPDAQLFGVRQDGKLGCVGFVHADGYEPGWGRMTVFFYRMIRTFGWRQFRTFKRVMNQKHTTGEKRLELLLLGTLAEFQGKGLGRRLIRHVFEYARERGYDAVTLEVAKDTPAYGFYRSEGFVDELDVMVGEMPLCFMGRVIEPA